MDKKLVDFIRVLRNADVRVSTSESIDAMHAIALLGYENRNLLKHALSSSLAKSEAEKESFDYCFENFFSFADLTTQPGKAAKTAEGEKEALVLSADTAAGNEVGLDPAQAENVEQLDSLAELLLENDANAIAIEIAQAGDATNASDIQIFTQKGQYSRRMLQQMGLEKFQQDVHALEQSEDAAQHALANELKQKLDWLREQVRNYVEQQYLLFASNSGQQLREEVLKKARLSSLDAHYHRDMQLLVRKMAKKLASQHARRKRIFKKGQLDAGKTIGRNIPNDGILFDTYWKSKRRERPKVFAICDVSGSVSLYARFLLMLLYSLHEVLPKVRAFAFSSRLGEVSETFKQYSLEKAIELVNFEWGMGSTDYGRAFEDFSAQCLESVDNHTTIIILGDARNNHGPARAELLKTLYDRCQRLLWINPEAKSLWGSGDSEMPRYAAYCHDASECKTLAQLENIISRLLRLTI